MQQQKSFAQKLIDWQLLHGRHDLPWQQQRTPYRVWLSEIMLQQTQVTSVKSYFLRFIDAFPNVYTLANADIDHVLALWSGLGYYSRARNLHRCAQIVASKYGGTFPSNSMALQTLPGVGPSTAAAIASLCFDEKVAIFDGNVQRVLARYLSFSGDLSFSQPKRDLQQHATDFLPFFAAGMPIYTQAIMDLGATVCKPKKPNCTVCPLQEDCQSHQKKVALHYPIKSKKMKRSSEHWWCVQWVRGDGAVWLEKRSPTGIWGGLYCFQMSDSATSFHPLNTVPQKHVLTHKDLYLYLVVVHFIVDSDCQNPNTCNINKEGAWHLPLDWKNLGLPTPMRLWLGLDAG